MVQSKTIQSEQDASSDKPWYEMDISNLPPQIAVDNDGGTDTDTADQSVSAVGSVDPDNPSRDCVFAVTVSGDYICYPTGHNLSDDGIALRAHLASYDANYDEFTVVEFEE